MGSFTITFGNKNYSFETKLSKANANLFSHWGTNLKNSVVTSNSIKVSNQADYDFVLRAFTDLAKKDGNANDISDNDFKLTSKSSQNCGYPKVKGNIWHSHEKGEYNYHTTDKSGEYTVRDIWLSDHDDEGV